MDKDIKDIKRRAGIVNETFMLYAAAMYFQELADERGEEAAIELMLKQGMPEETVQHFARAYRERKA